VKISKKKSKGYFKTFVIFLHVCLIILHNIEIYIYTIRYWSGIKIPDFLQNVSKKFLKIQKKYLKNL